MMLFVSCSTIKKNQITNRSNNQLNSLINKEWVMEYMSTVSKDLKEDYPQGVPTIRFNDKGTMLHVFDGCNRLNLPVKIEGNSIKIDGNGMSTMMYCENVRDNDFKKAISSIQTFSMNQGNLDLISGDIGVFRFVEKK
jgi:heat shock protein HslJ